MLKKRQYLSAKLYGFTSLMTVVVVQTTCLPLLHGVRFEVFVVVKMCMWAYEIVILWRKGLFMFQGGMHAWPSRWRWYLPVKG
jgi:hypothetical protein